MAYLDTTQCPHCGDIAFNKATIQNTEMAGSNITTANQNFLDRGLVPFCAPLIPVVYKCCATCGYLGMFSYKFLKDKGEL